MQRRGEQKRKMENKVFKEMGCLDLGVISGEGLKMEQRNFFWRETFTIHIENMKN